MKSAEGIVRARAETIIRDIRENFTDDEGILIGGWRNADTAPQGTIIDDLGDFLPFLAYFGAEDMCKRHLEHLEKNLETLNFQEAFKYSDLLFGLIWYARFGAHADLARRLMDRTADIVWNRFFARRLHSFDGYRRYPSVLSLFSSSDATFIEVFTELHRERAGGPWLARASQLASRLTAFSFFRSHGVLPELISFSLPARMAAVFYKEAHSVRLMKNNTNFGFGLLDLHRLHDERARSAFEMLYGGLRASAAKEGAMCNLPQKERTPDLLSSFAVIDLMCDAYALFGDERYREFAEAIAGFWLHAQSPRTGLFPKAAGRRMSYLDSETDMAVALWKLAELTEKKEYAAAAAHAVEGVFSFHRGPKGYVLEVDCATGEHIDDGYKTKYLALLLKPLIYQHAAAPVYGNDALHMLLKDR